MRACATLARIRRHYACRLNSSVRPHMPQPSNPTKIHHSRGSIRAEYPVLEIREIGELVVVVYDYMAFPRGQPARNLFAYSTTSGQLAWRADDIGMGATDAYTNILSEQPLVVGNFAGYNCTIDLRSGRVVTKAFTK